MDTSSLLNSTIFRSSPTSLHVGLRTICRAHSFVRAAMQSAEDVEMEVRPGMLYRVTTGLCFMDLADAQLLAVRPSAGAWQLGLVVERHDLSHAGELIVYVSARVPVRLTASSQTPVFEVSCADGISGGFDHWVAPATTAVKEPKVVKVTVPRGASRPSGAAERSDEEKARLFMEEGDDVPARFTHPDGGVPSIPAAVADRARVLPGEQ